MPVHGPDFPPDPTKVTDTGDWCEFTNETDKGPLNTRIRVQRNGRSLRYEYEVGSVEDSTPRLSNRSDGRAIRWNGVRSVGDLNIGGVMLPDEVDEKIRRQEDEFEADITAQMEAYGRAMRNEPVIFTVRRIGYQTAAATPGRNCSTVRVLVSMVNSREVDTESLRNRFLNEKQRDVFTALRDVLGDAKGLPYADGDDNPFTDEERGTRFTVDEVADRVDGFEEAMVAAKHQREEREAWDALVEQHPILYGVSSDVESVKTAMTEAADRNEPVPITTTSVRCDDAQRECSLDRLTYQARPNGEIDAKRVHTY